MPDITTRDGQTYPLAFHKPGAPTKWNFYAMQVGDSVTFPLGTAGARKAIGASRNQAHRMRTKTGWAFQFKYEYKYEYPESYARRYANPKGHITITRVE